MTKQQKLNKLNNLRALLLNAAQNTQGQSADYYNWAANIIGRKLNREEKQLNLL